MKRGISRGEGAGEKDANREVKEGEVGEWRKSSVGKVWEMKVLTSVSRIGNPMQSCNLVDNNNPSD